MTQEEIDIGALVSDSDVPSDDSNSWMQKIDVTNFRELTEDDQQQQRALLDHVVYTSKSTTTTTQQQLAISATDLIESQSILSSSSTSSSSSSSTEYLLTTSTINDHHQRPTMITSAPTTTNTTATSTSISRYPKPTYSYSCLIALSLKNSKTGRLTVAEIYNFMCENFPYFRTAPSGWKNSVRHNLSLNKCFQKIELEAPGGHGRKSCLWMLNPQKVIKMDQEIRKWRERDPVAVKESLACADDLEAIEQGLKGLPGDSDSTSYMFGSLPDINPHLLLVKTTNLHNGGGANKFIRHASTDTNFKWGSAAKVARLTTTNMPAPAKTPPLVGIGRCRSMTIPPDGESMSAAAARNLQAVLQQQQQHHLHYQQQQQSPNGGYSTPTRGCNTSAAILQSSPFNQTPPYSPNVTSSPQLIIKSSDNWGACRSQPADHYVGTSPFGSPPMFGGVGYGSQYSPCHQLNSYDTAASALNNNSLLQSALAQSPCRGPALTFQTL